MAMKELNTDQKLQLVQQIRSRYNENQYDMYNRERILYGKGAAISGENTYNTHASGTDFAPSSFRLRLLLAVLLFAGVVAMDINHLTISGVTAEKIVEVIALDYEERLDQWMTALSK